MGGDVEVASSPAEGTTVTVRMPLSASSGPGTSV
jgi:signal transduction histidine kinase